MSGNNSPSQFEQIRSLADARFDGTIDRDQTELLEKLILSDSRCLQAYVERMAYHGSLTKNAGQRSPAQAAMRVLRAFSEANALQERRWRYATFVIPASVVAALLLAVTVWMMSVKDSDPAQLGVIASLSSNALTTTKEVDLGSIVRVGETFEVMEGIVSLQMPTAIVDLIGPTIVKLDGSERIVLNSGTLVAKMLKTGGGLTVLTPDAKVVDLGTEFLVKHDSELGTHVSVRKGRVQATLLDRRNSAKRTLDLTEHRSAHFQSGASKATEVDFQPQLFSKVDESRGDMERIEGLLRTVTHSITSLVSGETMTHNHALVIPERQRVVLQEDLTIQGLSGPVRIPAGTTVSSYLVHYDPTTVNTRAPRGAVTFFGSIAGIITETDDLKATDSLLGLNDTQFEQADFRGMELGPNEDVILVSSDRRTVSFRFDTSPPRSLDEARILVIVSDP